MTFWFWLGTTEVVLLVRQVGGGRVTPLGVSWGVMGINEVSMILDENLKKNEKNDFFFKFF